MPMRTVAKAFPKVSTVVLTPPRELLPFVQHAPMTVLTRSCLEWLFDAKTLNQLFEETADKQYTRELTLDFMAYVMLDLICGIHASAGAALRAHRERIDVSRQAFYAKLGRMEPAVSEAIVEHIAQRAEAVIGQLHGPNYEPLPGWSVRVADGSYLGGRTQHRLGFLRKTRCAGLTGMIVAVFAPVTGVLRQVVLEEDAYTQERRLFDRLAIGPKEVWIADRNFCVRTFLLRICRAGSAFLVRWHGSSCPYEELEPWHPAAGGRQGAWEQRVRIADPDTKEELDIRRIVLPLAEPTRKRDTQLILVTSLPETVAADALCDLYHGRWHIETHFQRLTQQLHCEPPGLSRPRAALFAFAMAAAAANALALVLRALEAQHGWEAVRELSYYYLVYDVDHTWLGMKIVVPGPRWHFIGCASAPQLARWLLEVAGQVPMQDYRRSKRGPKKPQPKRTSGKGRKHVSVKRLLDEARAQKAQARAQKAC